MTPSITRMLHRLAVWGLVLLLAACAGSPEENATGEQIFSQLCASCHSRDLSGGIGPALGPGSAAEELSDELIAQTIREGRGSRMPAFARTLSDEQIVRVVEFLRERQAE